MNSNLLKKYKKIINWFPDSKLIKKPDIIKGGSIQSGIYFAAFWTVENETHIVQFNYLEDPHDFPTSLDDIDFWLLAKNKNGGKEFTIDLIGNDIYHTLHKNLMRELEDENKKLRMNL